MFEFISQKPGAKDVLLQALKDRKKFKITISEYSDESSIPQTIDNSESLPQAKTPKGRNFNKVSQKLLLKYP